jgi:hypothetical protein
MVRSVTHMPGEMDVARAKPDRPDKADNADNADGGRHD